MGGTLTGAAILMSGALTVALTAGIKEDPETGKEKLKLRPITPSLVLVMLLNTVFETPSQCS